MRGVFFFVGRKFNDFGVVLSFLCKNDFFDMFFVRAIRFRLIFGEVPFFLRNGYAQRDVFGFSVLCHPEHQRVIAIIQDFRLVTDDFYCCIHGILGLNTGLNRPPKMPPKSNTKKAVRFL